MNIPIRIQVPYAIWRVEAAFRRWLEWREITDFFWEVDRNDEYVTIQVFDGAEENNQCFTELFYDPAIVGEDNRGGL